MDNNNLEPRERPASPSARPESPSQPAVDSTPMPPAVLDEPPPTPPLFPYAGLAQEPPVESRRPKWGPWVIGALAGALLLAAVLWAAGAFEDGPSVAADGAEPQVVDIREVITPADEQTSARAVARKVIPSIVTVDVGSDNNGTFERFGSGSGVVLRANGYIVTNQHVVEGAERVQVIFDSGRIYEAEIVGSDKRTDLAVVQIEATGLVPIELGTTDEAEIGQVAIAVGSPLGLEGGPSLTAGVISAFGRQVRTGSANDDILFDMLQTDAPIIQGSSGGALVDGRGRLLGITSAIGVSAAGPEGIGFAIPIELVTRITDEIIETGSVAHAFLGVSLRDVFDVATDGAQVPAGAIISEFPVRPSAAETAGLQPGDVVVGLDGEPVLISDDLISALRRMRVGDTVTLDVVRDTEWLEIDVVLGTRPDGL
ncbi:MAG: trypsin-like peptidase domain-containing protein [Acidimicrobiia bacterium]|nr:trypsin-like peptidase domain-containing protein [Acidimicrobiia bacterium]